MLILNFWSSYLSCPMGLGAMPGPFVSCMGRPPHILFLFIWFRQFYLFKFFWDWFLLCSPGWLGTHIFLSLLPECWDYRCAPSCLASSKFWIPIKRAGDLAQMVKCLPSKHKALSSNSNTTITKNWISTWIVCIHVKSSLIIPWYQNGQPASC
jgi:hypothetical protein